MKNIILFIISIYSLDIQTKKPKKPDDILEKKKSGMVESLLLDIKKLSSEIEKIKFKDDEKTE
jgi:hypothetical protein